MHILVISDAWHPQVNGVVRTYENLGRELRGQGHRFEVVGPQDFRVTVSVPGYSEIKSPPFAFFTLPRLISAKMSPDTHIHIATEGALGRAARAFCLKQKIPFSTCYHTEFPDYIAKRAAKLSPFLYGPVRKYAARSLRAFHAPATTVFVATQSLEDRLKAQGYTCRFARLTRGVDADLFKPDGSLKTGASQKPVALCVARVAIEKNLEAFLAADWAGSKIVVGDGPDMTMLKNKYPEVLFTGKKEGRDLAAFYQSADIFVFPSRTDTFGMVLIEALACGLAVAAYPVPGPLDIITAPQLGVLDEDLAKAMAGASQAPGEDADRAAHVRQVYTWNLAAAQFLGGVKRAL